jgi:hypothetical protein
MDKIKDASVKKKRPRDTFQEPTEVILTDGRRFPVSELKGRVRDYHHIYLYKRVRGQKTYSKSRDQMRLTRQLVLKSGTYRGGGGREPKYSDEERNWIARATIPEIAERYEIKTVQARTLRWQSEKILGIR